MGSTSLIVSLFVFLFVVEYKKNNITKAQDRDGQDAFFVSFDFWWIAKPKVHFHQLNTIMHSRPTAPFLFLSE